MSASKLVASSSVLALVHFALSGTPALGQKPKVIRDINVLADGRGANESIWDPSMYPLTASSYPDTPRVVVGSDSVSRLYFLAQDTTGSRKLFRFKPSAPNEVDRVTEVKAGGTTPLVRPRLLTLFDHYLFCVSGPDNAPVVMKATDANAAVVTFGAITPTDIPGMTADADRLTALVTAVIGGATCSSLRVLHANDASFGYHLDADDTFGKPADLIAFGEAFAFTTVNVDTGGPRCLKIATDAFKEYAVGSPAYLTPFGTKVVMVDTNTSLDTLKVFDGTSVSDPAVGDGIHSLTVRTVSGVSKLFFVADANSASPKLRALDANGSVTVPTPAGPAGTQVASVASIGVADGELFVLGVVKDAAGVHTTTLWRHYDAIGGLTDKLVPLQSFPLLVAAHDLHVFVDGTSRGAFVALAANQSSPQPVIMVSQQFTWGLWTPVEVPGVVAGGSVDLVRRVGDWLFFRAAAIRYGSEAWSWNFR